MHFQILFSKFISFSDLFYGMYCCQFCNNFQLLFQFDKIKTILELIDSYI